MIEEPTLKAKVFMTLRVTPMTRVELCKIFKDSHSYIIDNMLTDLLRRNAIHAIGTKTVTTKQGIDRQITVYDANQYYNIEDLNIVRIKEFSMSDDKIVLWHSLEDAKKIRRMGRKTKYIDDLRLTTQELKDTILRSNPLFMMYGD